MNRARSPRPGGLAGAGHPRGRVLRAHPPGRAPGRAAGASGRARHREGALRPGRRGRKFFSALPACGLRHRGRPPEHAPARDHGHDGASERGHRGGVFQGRERAGKQDEPADRLRRIGKDPCGAAILQSTVKFRQRQIIGPARLLERMNCVNGCDLSTRTSITGRLILSMVPLERKAKSRRLEGPAVSESPGA